MNFNEKCIQLQSLLIEANMSAYGTGRIYKRPKIVFKLKRLKQAGKEADRKEKHLSPEKVKRFLNNEIWAMDEQEELELATSD